MNSRHSVWRSALAAAITMIAASAVAAQPSTSGVPNAMQGFSVNRDKPIKINANTLEVRDKEKKATFLGNVVVVQGDTTMKCKSLDVFYDQDGAGGTTAQAGGGQQQIRRLEAKGGVIVSQKDQTATGETGIYDMQTNSVTLIGKAVVTQGPNIVRGDRIEIDLTTGIYRVLGDRVESLIIPQKNPPTKDAPKSAPKRAPNQPMKLN